MTLRTWVGDPRRDVDPDEFAVLNNQCGVVAIRPTLDQATTAFMTIQANKPEDGPYHLMVPNQVLAAAEGD